MYILAASSFAKDPTWHLSLFYSGCKSAAHVRMEIPVLVWSLKSSILSSTSLQMNKTFWGVVSAAVEQSRRKANMVAQGDGKFGPWGWPQDPSKPKKKPAVCCCKTRGSMSFFPRKNPSLTKFWKCNENFRSGTMQAVSKLVFPLTKETTLERADFKAVWLELLWSAHTLSVLT